MAKETPMSTAVCKLFMHKVDWLVIFHTGGRSPAQDKSTPIGWYIIASAFATYIFFFTLDAEKEVVVIWLVHIPKISFNLEMFL